MIDAYLLAMRRYAVFAGRAPRGEYWWFQLSLAVLLFVALFMDGIVGEDTDSAILAGIVMLVHILPGIGVGVRRLHDIDRSGWFILIALVPVVGPIVLAVWACQPGTPGGNQFGPNPLATAAGIPAWGTRPLAAAGRDVVADIERLAGLRASGTLSAAEFEALKAQVMVGTAPA